MINKKSKIEKSNAIEYNSHTDASIIRKELKKSKLISKIKILTFILFFLLYEVLTYIFKNNINLFGIVISPLIYLVLSAFILSVALLCNFNICNTIKHLIGNKLTIIFSSLATYSQIIYLILFPDSFGSYTNLLIGIILIFLMFNSLNKIICTKRILKNLRFISSSNEKYSAKIYHKDYLSNNTLKYIENSDPVGITKVKVNKLTNFIKNSYKSESFEKYTNILSFSLIAIAITIGIINFLTNKNLYYSLSEITALLLLCYPISLILSLNISLYSSCKKALRKGSLITNEDTINKFSKINLAVIDASSLYPSKNVILKEIKTFRGQRIDEAILYAATLASTKDDTLNKVFNRIILGQKKILEKVSNVIYEDKLGISGWINGQKIIIGNREILKKNNIDPPSRDYENKYTKQNEGLIYIAVGKELVAMFILEYKPNKKLKNELLKSIKSGIEILIRTSDTNVTKDRISSDFGITKNLIKILPYDENIYSNENISFKETDEADLSVTAGQESILKAASLCKKTSINFKLIYALQAISLLLSLLISVFLILNNSINQINEIEIIIYISFWAIVSLICAKFK